MTVTWRPIRPNATTAHAFRVVCEGAWRRYEARSVCNRDGKPRFEENNKLRKCPECLALIAAKEKKR